MRISDWSSDVCSTDLQTDKSTKGLLMPRSAPKAPFEQLRLFVHFLPCRGRAKATIPDARQGGFLGFFQARVEPDQIEVAVAGCRFEQWFLCHDMAPSVAGWDRQSNSLKSRHSCE